MPTPQEILADPNFHQLPIGERLKVMRTVDPNFASLPSKEQGMVLYQSAAQFHPEVNANTPTDKGFWSTIGSDVAALPGGIYNSIRHPFDTLANATEARRSLGPKAEKAAKEGDYSSALGYGIASKLPFIGPAAAKAGEELGGGQPGEGAAHATELLAPFALKRLSEIPQVKAGTRAARKVIKSRITGEPIEGAPSTPALPGPYFNERSTYDPNMRGKTPPASTPPPTGTVHIPPEVPPAPPPGINTTSPAGRVNPASRATGTPPTGTVNVPPSPAPDLGTQAPQAIHPLASPITTNPPSKLFVGQSGTIPGEITQAAEEGGEGAEEAPAIVQPVGKTGEFSNKKITPKLIEPKAGPGNVRGIDEAKRNTAASDAQAAVKQHLETLPKSTQDFFAKLGSPIFKESKTKLPPEPKPTAAATPESAAKAASANAALDEAVANIEPEYKAIIKQRGRQAAISARDADVDTIAKLMRAGHSLEEWESANDAGRSTLRKEVGAKDSGDIAGMRVAKLWKAREADLKKAMSIAEASLGKRKK